VGNAVFTATNAAAAATAVGLGATNEVTFNNITISDQTLTLSDGAEDNVIVRNESGNLELESPVTIRAFSPISFNNTTNAATTRTNLGLGVTNNVTFSNITASGTLGVTGNVTLSGVNNTAPNATNAASASSLMTRELSDDRYTTYVWLTGGSDNQTITNGGFKFLGPSRINSFSLGYGASIPAGYTKFRVLLNFGWLTDPATNSSNFQVFVRFNNMGALSTSTQESEHGSVAGVSLYPTNSPTNGLVGTLTRLGVVNTTNSIYSFRSEYETIPAAWQNNAASNGFFHLQGVAIRNNTGASVTDAFNANHAPVGIVEFRK
jgi:hypothetical protein